MIGHAAGVPVFIDPYVPEFKPRHPSVQRWWPRVLQALGEPERGDRAYWMVAGGLRIHPNNADSLLNFIHPVDELAERRRQKQAAPFPSLGAGFSWDAILDGMGHPNCRCAATPIAEPAWWRRVLFFFEKRWLLFKVWRLERLLRKAERRR